MDVITAVLLVLIGVVAPVGWVSDRLTTEAIRQQLEAAADIDVRIDNAPSYRLLQGRVQRVRVAGEGLVPLAGVRIERLNFEATGIAIAPASLRGGALTLNAPLEAAAQLILTEADVNRALQSPTVVAALAAASVRLPGAAAAGIERYEWINPRVDFLAGDRLRLRVTLQERRNRRQLNIVAESGLALIDGRTLRLVAPAITVDGQVVPPELLQAWTQRPIDLQRLIGDDLLARLLQLEITAEELAIAAWVRIPSTAATPPNP